MFSPELQLYKQLQLTPQLVSPHTPQSLQRILVNYRAGTDRKQVTVVWFVYLGVAVQIVHKAFPWGVSSEW